MTGACAEMRDQLPELVLGILDGAERAVVVDHLASCASCREEVARLTEAVDGLNLVAPSMAPSAGFERRLLSHVSATATAPATGRRAPARRSLLAIAASLLVTVGSAAALTATGVGSRPVHAEAAPMIAPSGDRVGDAYLVDSNPPVAVVAVAYSGGRADYQPQLAGVATSGEVVALGLLHWKDGRWRWAGEIENGLELTGFRVIGPRGETFCEGQLGD